MKIKPVIENMEKVLDYIENTLKEQEAPEKMITSMSIAVDEILSNIVYYSGATEAEILCSYDGKCAVVSLEDNGAAYNPLLKEDPDIMKSIEEREIGGLGIFMVKKMVQEVNYRYDNGKNHLELICTK